MSISDALTDIGAAYTSSQVLRLPSSVPRLLDLRRWLLLGYVTIEYPGYLANAKVHYRKSHWGISGSRVHNLWIWRDTGEMTTSKAIYQHCRGNVRDHLDDEGRIFLQLILEYFL